MIPHTPQMTDKKIARIYKSVQFIAVMAELIKMEHLSDLVDSRFKNPVVNQFAKRIKNDANEIQFHLKKNDKVMIEFQDIDFIENYAAELCRVFHFFIGIPFSQIKTVMDSIMNAAISIEAGIDNEAGELYQSIYGTIEYALMGAELEHKDRSEGIRNATMELLKMINP